MNTLATEVERSSDTTDTSDPTSPARRNPVNVTKITAGVAAALTAAAVTVSPTPATASPTASSWKTVASKTAKSNPLVTPKAMRRTATVTVDMHSDGRHVRAVARTSNRRELVRVDLFCRVHRKSAIRHKWTEISVAHRVGHGVASVGIPKSARRPGCRVTATSYVQVAVRGGRVQREVAMSNMWLDGMFRR